MRAACPFLALGSGAIIAGGLVAAIQAHQPVPVLVWMSAYLVLIAGAAQVVFGAGQAWLSERPPTAVWIAAEWLVFNLGNAGVIAGTLYDRFAVVLAGTLLFAAGIALFLLGTRGGTRRAWRVGYRVLLGLIFLSSLVGLALSVQARMH
ncbi:MAG: hypothetical protein EPN38_05700 [Rhodanobacteraceae bacterium]|nr:MAG: hypothetical protein EPN38_05700 [Rhodanobacteraceae bacterium]